VTQAVDNYRDGNLSAAEASTAISRTVRSFLHQATGLPAQYMHLGAIGGGLLAAAAPLLSQLGEVQFNSEAQGDVIELAAQAQELIRSWS